MDSENVLTAMLGGVAASAVQYLARVAGFDVKGPTAQVVAAALAVGAAVVVAGLNSGVRVDDAGDLGQVALIAAGTSQMFYNVIVSRLSRPA